MRLFARKYSWPHVPHEDIVRRARVLVVDDEDFPYRLLFKRDGYNVEKWNDVKTLAEIESGQYDLILLDLLGVGRKQSSDEGLGLLKHLRSAAPTQLVVAYSNADWPVSYQPFFEMADAVLAKTADYTEFKRTVDGLLDQRFSLGFYLDRVQRELDMESVDSRRIRNKAQQAIEERRTDTLSEFLRAHLEDPVAIDRILTVVSIAISVANLWKK